MRKGLKYLAAAAVVAAQSCKPLETYIANADNYLVQPIITERNLLEGEKYLLGGYALRQRGADAADISLFVDKETHRKFFEITGREGRICGFSVNTYRTGFKAADGSGYIYKQENSIAVQSGDVMSAQESVVSLDKNADYVQFHDASLGVITIRYYESPNRNAPDAKWRYHTGFRMLIGGQEYGILALYSPAFYTNRHYPHTLTPAQQERLTAYALMVWGSFQFK